MPSPNSNQIPQQGAPKTPVNYQMRHGSGVPIPPYPLIGESFVEFATAQQEAARTHAYFREHHGMEVDAFGFAQFHRRPEPAANQLEGAQESNIETAQVEEPPSSLALESARVLSEEEDDAQYEQMGESDQARNPYELNSRPIISRENPEFREVALRLESMQESSGLASIQTPPSGRTFRPSMMALEKYGLVDRPSRDSKYLGHKFKEHRHAVPDALNCGLWLSCLDPMTTVEELFGVIRTGAVYALNITPPQDGYPTAAASVYFMAHSGAEQFLGQVNSRQGIIIRSSRIKAIYNKHGQEQQSNLERTRVLRISGPAQEMTRDFWEKFFERRVDYQLSHIMQRSRNGGRRDMEFGFARIDGQACSVKLAIEAEPAFRGIFQVGYGKDPCDPHGRPQ